MILSSLSLPAWADSVYFNPVATINARTIKKGTLSLGRAPLGNINSTFLANTLNYGLFSRMEIGTSPIFYTAPEHQYNYVMKLSFWKGDWIDWALVLGKNVFRTKVEKTTGGTERTELEMTAYQLAFNIHPPEMKTSLGASVTQSCAYIASKDPYIFIASYKCVGEVGVDLQQEWRENHWITIGYGRMRESGISPYEELATGLGGTYTWLRPDKLISRPSLGIYQTFNGDTLFLISTTFYESE